MSWQTSLKNELVSPKLVPKVEVEQKDPDGCCEDVKAELIANIDKGENSWIAWYLNLLIEDIGPIEDLTCSELKEGLAWEIDESKANAYIHEKPERNQTEIKPENKEHEQANPFFTQLLQQLEKDCESLVLDDDTNTSINFPKDSSSWKEQLKKRFFL